MTKCREGSLEQTKEWLLQLTDDEWRLRTQSKFFFSFFGNIKSQNKAETKWL